MKNKIYQLIFPVISLLIVAQKTLAVTCGTGYVEMAGVCVPSNTGLPSASVTNILFNFLGWILVVFGFFAIIAFAISGIQYLTSAGDEKQLETAKRNMKWSIVGTTVGISGYVLVQAISRALSGIADI